jgi:hypothetical protein
MSEFERTKRTVGNRTILVTSWFDETKQTWRASAPAYSHLGAIVAAGLVDCTTRNAALDSLSARLARHFESQNR